MPELPEVETIVRGIRPSLIGRAITKVRVERPDLLREADPEAFARALTGGSIRDVRRRAKRILVELPGRILMISLGMTGRLLARPDPGPELTHIGIRLRLSDDQWIVYQDVRRFGSLTVVDPAEWAAIDAGLGLEPLGEEFTISALEKLRRGSRAPVKNWIMDQRRVVGVGNIYASEALFRAGIHPARPAGRISSRRAGRLREAIRTVLGEAIESRGTTLLDYRDHSGEPGGFRSRLRVYDRAGEPCLRCGCTVRRIVQAGRSTFYCAGCQR